MGAHEVPVEHRSDRARYVDLVVDEMIPAVAAAGPGGVVRRVLRGRASSRRPNRDANSRGGPARGPEGAHPCRRTRRERRIAGRRRRRRTVRGPPHLRAARRDCGDGASQRGGDAPPDGGVLPQAWPLRAGACTDRRGGAGRARDRRQPRRRVLAVDALRDDARVLCDGPDVRGSTDRRDDQRRVVARSRRTTLAASSPASWPTR